MSRFPTRVSEEEGQRSSIHLRVLGMESGRSWLSFVLPQPTWMELAVYDVLGRQVAVLAKGVYSAGEHRLTLNLPEVTSGVYLLRMTTPTEHRTVRFLQLR